MNRDFWQLESLRYTESHFRLEKCAKIINSLSKNRGCDLLDVGCGPATIAKLLQKNIHYYGIDLVIHAPAPNLLEMDIRQNEIGFNGRMFDIVFMQGVFEYLGDHQHKKLGEIHHVLKQGGKFIVTYVNFSHFRSLLLDNSMYNNIQPIEVFKSDLESFFIIDKSFPTSYNWNRTEPKRGWLKKIQMPLHVRLPVLSTYLAVEYVYICSPRNEEGLD